MKRATKSYNGEVVLDGFDREWREEQLFAVIGHHATLAEHLRLLLHNAHHCVVAQVTTHTAHVPEAQTRCLRSDVNADGHEQAHVAFAMQIKPLQISNHYYIFSILLCMHYLCRSELKTKTDPIPQLYVLCIAKTPLVGFQECQKCILGLY